MSVFSVTEVRNALRCPRIFALGRLTGQSVAFPVGSSCLGAPFHRIVDRFSRSLDRPPASCSELPAGAPQELVAERLSGWLIQHLHHELQRAPAYQTMPAEVDDLAEALRQLAAYLAERISGSERSPVDAVTSLMGSPETEASAKLGEQEGVATHVQGRVDSIQALDQGQVDVVEYKLTDHANQELDQAQVALYRELLRRDRGIDGTPVILRFTPQLSVTRLGKSEADDLVRRRLLPLLGEMERWVTDPRQAPATERKDLCIGCPYWKRCSETYADRVEARDAPPTLGTRPTVTPDGEVTAPAEVRLPAPDRPRDTDGEQEAEAFKEALLKLHGQLGVNVKAKPPQVGPRMVSVALWGRSVKAIDRVSEDVIQTLDAEYDLPASYYKSRTRRFEVPRKQPRTVQLKDLLADQETFLKERSGRFVLGETMTGETLVGDLSSPASCHLLVGGTNGSGKSVFLKGVIMSLTTYHGPDAVRLVLVDPKRVTFGNAVARGLAGHLARPVVFDSDEALAVMEDLVVEMERRYQLLEDVGVENIDEYNEDVAAPQRLHRVVVVVDEFADLMLDKATKAPFETAVKRLGGKARASGIHLVFATQRPDAKVVPGILKANLIGRVALRVADGVNSKIILDKSGAGGEALLGNGDLIASLGKGLVRAQAPFVK